MSLNIGDHVRLRDGAAEWIAARDGWIINEFTTNDLVGLRQHYTKPPLSVVIVGPEDIMLNLAPSSSVVLLTWEDGDRTAFVKIKNGNWEAQGTSYDTFSEAVEDVTWSSDGAKYTLTPLFAVPDPADDETVHDIWVNRLPASASLNGKETVRAVLHALRVEDESSG